MATTTKVRIKKAELAGSTISTATYGRFKFDSEGIAKVPIELARELIESNTGFIVIDDNGNPIELPPDDIGDDTIPGGDDTIKPEPVESYTLSGGGTYTTIEGGFVISGENSKYTLVGSEIDKDKIFVKDDKVGFKIGINTDSIHMLGVDSGSTIIIGDTSYQWVDKDNNAENGLELVSISSGEDTIQPIPTEYPLSGGGKYHTIDGGYELVDNGSKFTLVGSSIDSDNIYIKDGKVQFNSGINTNSIHIIGVEENSTVRVGEKDYKWVNSDNNAENGLELVEIIEDNPTIPGGDDTIKPEPIVYDLVNGGTYTTIEGGFVISGENSKFTLTGDSIDTENIYVAEDKILFKEGLNPSSVHIFGVDKDSTIAIGNDIYKFDNSDNISSNGMELVLVESENDTVEPQPTLPSGDDTIPSSDTVNSFEYDFDGKSFTVTGGLNENISTYDLNEKATYDGNKLTVGEGIVDNLNDVHIQGLNENTEVNVDGEKFTLQDTDNNPDNGLELFGETSDANGWVYSNRSKKSEPQIWEHYEDGEEDIVVVGCIGRPSIVENTLTITGEEFKAITNFKKDELIINSNSIKGKLTKGVSWKAELGIKVGLGTNSHIYYNNTLYLPRAYLTEVKDELEYTLSKGVLTIISGTIDPSKLTAKGSSVSSVKYKNKTYFVNVKTGKLVQNAWQKRGK